jgi:hypothetical protein
MTGKNPQLLESFNKAAAAFGEGDIRAEMLSAHFYSAMRYGASNDMEKQALTDALFDNTVKRLMHFTTSGIYAFNGTTADAAAVPVLDALTSPEAREFVTKQASLKMTEIIMAASAVSASTRRTRYPGDDGPKDYEHYQTQMAKLAALALNYADIFASPLPAASIQTAKDITPARRIILKQGEGTQP